MMDIEEFYFTGLPIETSIGYCHFLTIEDYAECFIYLQYVSMTKEQILSELAKNYIGADKNELEALKQYTFYELICNLANWHVSYAKVFTKVFRNEDILTSINEENFYELRKLILKMSCIKEEEINPNPEIQKFIEMSKRAKSREGDKQTLGDMTSSIVGYNGLSYSDINSFTIYQLYLTYYRICHFKNYDTSTLFSTVSTEKIKIDSWSKHIDLFEEEKHYITQEEFKKNIGSVLDD